MIFSIKIEILIYFVIKLYNPKQMKYLNWVKNAETPDQKNFLILPYDEKKKKRYAVMNFAFGILLLILLVSAGVLNHPSSRTAWIFYPYILNFIPLGHFFAGAFLFMKFPVNLSKKQWDSSLARCKHSAAGLLIFFSLNFLLDVIFLITHRKNGFNAFEFIYILIFAVMILVIIFYSKFYDKRFVNKNI